MFDFCIEENHEVFGSFTQNFLHLDKDKSTVSTFSVFLVDNYAVITTQTSSFVHCSNFSQQRFVLVHLFPDIAIKSTQLHFHNYRKNFPNDFAHFSKNDCQSIKE